MANQQDRQYNQNQSLIQPKFLNLHKINKSQKSIFTKAQIVDICEEKSNPTSENAHLKPSYTAVYLREMYDDENTQASALIRLYPAKSEFNKDHEEIKKQEHLQFFLSLKPLSFVQILNAKVKKNKQFPNDKSDKPEQQKNYKVIGLNEWSQVREVKLQGENISSITANNKFVNIIAKVTCVEHIKEITQPVFKKQSDQRPEDSNTPQQEDKQGTTHKDGYHKITFRDSSGEIYCILPKIEKFNLFEKIEQALKEKKECLLYLEKAQIQFYIKKGVQEEERNIYLNIFVNNSHTKQKGFIKDLTHIPEFQDKLKSISIDAQLPNVSQKVWIAKTN